MKTLFLLHRGRIPISIALCLILINKSAAQESPTISVPSSPAFSILNFEPSSVLKPTSQKDLAADVLSAFDENGKLLMNLGLEVAPYWLKSRPTLTKEKYLHPKPGQALLQSLNISAATVKDSVSGNNKLGVGLRFRLFNGEPVKEYLEKEAELKGQLNIVAAVAAAKAMVGTLVNTREEAIAVIVDALIELEYKQPIIDAFKAAAAAEAEKHDDSKTGITNFLAAIATSVVDTNGNLISKVAELSKKRVGFILEMAGAGSFITSQSKDGVFERAGIWLNASNYVTENDAWTVSARYFFANKDSSLSNFDGGISYLKEQSRFSFSLEGMVRWYRAEIPDVNINNDPIIRVEKDFTYRFAVQSAYRIGRDISVNLSLGKDFDSPFISGSGFFSILGFNYSIFKREKVDLAK